MGRSGLQLSAFSFGSWVTFAKQVDLSAAERLMGSAYDAGINFFDNAEGYESGQSEVLMGRALKSLGWGRDTFVLSSKVFWGGSRPNQKGLSRKHIRDACDAALKRLQVDYLDLFFCHRPDIDTPIEETVSAMDILVREGKVLYWGTSQWSGQQITEAVLTARAMGAIPPAMEQPEYNFFARDRMERDLLPAFRLGGLGTTTWSPLASGLLTGKYNHSIPKDSRLNLPGYEWLKAEYESPAGRAKMDHIRRLTEVAAKAGLKLHHMALLWCLSNPHVTSVILGASRLDQLTDNLEALKYQDRLDESCRAAIEEVLDNKPPGPERF
jgi:voltage-dependent potassium channel beta subunit